MLRVVVIGMLLIACFSLVYAEEPQAEQIIITIAIDRQSGEVKITIAKAEEQQKVESDSEGNKKHTRRRGK